MKISLMMIVANETDSLRRCLDSVAKHVDEIVVGFNGTNKKTRKILEEFDAKIIEFKWEEDFVASVSEQLEKRRSLSDRQIAILECIYAEKT